MKERKFSFIIVVAAMLWGTSGMIQGVAPKEAVPEVVGALRLMISGLIFLICSLIKYQNISVKVNKHLLLSAIFIGLFQPLFFLSVKSLGVGTGTMLVIVSAPIVSALIGFIKGTKITKHWLISTMLSILGCIILFYGRNSMSINGLGFIFALMAGCSYSLFVQTSKQVYVKNNALKANGWIFSLAGILLLPMLFLNDTAWIVSVHGATTMLFLGTFSTAIPYLLFAMSLRHVKETKAVTLTLIEPLTATVLGVLILHESLSILSSIGIVMMILGLLMSAYEKQELVYT